MRHTILSDGGPGFNPSKYDKHGPAYATKDVMKACMKSILVDNYFKRRKAVKEDLKQAIEDPR